MRNGIAYTQLNIGCLSRNKFWGEPTDRPVRSAMCTSTLIELADESFLLVDPGVPYDDMKEIIFNRRGVSIDKVRNIFLTHFHGDHTVELERYIGCKFYASKEEVALSESSLPVNVEVLEDQLPGVKLYLLPGHTMGTSGLGFVSDGLNVLVAGDVVATKDFLLAGEVFYNAVDEKLAKDSAKYVAKEFDIIVPGHDVQFKIKK